MKDAAPVANKRQRQERGRFRQLSIFSRLQWGALATLICVILIDGFDIVALDWWRATSALTGRSP